MPSAIEKTKGPCIILAGAGTGKTYIIVEKIKYILENNIYEPERIVCLTFSNEAANSLRSRILPYINNDKEPIIKTFHSFCSDILKKHGEKIGISENFKILMPDDAKIMLHKNLRVKTNFCHKYINSIGTAKDLGISIERMKNFLEDRLPEKKEKLFQKELEMLRFKLQTFSLSKGFLSNSFEQRSKKSALQSKIKQVDDLINLKKFIRVWEAYEKLKKKKNLQDYSDLNKNALVLLQKYPEISLQYSFIVVDEFQDTNKLQCDFLKLIAPHKNITVVGDLNQSIYGFRGAHKENLHFFKKDFNTSPNDIFALDKSYRSTNKILKIAHELIKNNYKDKRECFEVVSALNRDGEKIKVFELLNSKEEARKIAEIIESEVSRGTSLDEICVMFRTHQQSRVLKNYLDFKNVPYASVTKKSLLKLTPIKIVIDYLTILEKIRERKSGGEHAWWDLVYNSGFDKEDIIKISEFIKESKHTRLLSIKMLNFLEKLNLSEKGKAKSKILLMKIKSLLSHTDKPIPELVLRVFEASGVNSEDAKTSFQKEQFLVLQKFHELAKDFSEIESGALSGFLDHLNVMNQLGIEVEVPSLRNSGVRIMTHHATKGLEYETIIVSNMAQKRFPIERISENPFIPAEFSSDLKAESEEAAAKECEKESQILEERRLCYVAFTRAKSRLYITYANQYSSYKFLPSQFLDEINYKNNELVDFEIDRNEKYDVSIGKISKEEMPLAVLDNIKFSPSSLQTFSECKKKYEYKYIYNMPEPAPVSWEAIKLGSFIHLVLEEAVKNNIKDEKEISDLAKVLQMKEEWSLIELSEVMPMVKIFLERNKRKYDSNSLTEQHLTAKISDFDFYGFADRIDFHSDGLEIIDYKTGDTDVKPKFRNWQLGFYAIAANQKFGKIKKLTLEMLKKENPIEFEIDENGNAKEIHSARTSFNLGEVQRELTETANQIIGCYDKGFPACEPEKHCKFCEEFVWER